MLGSLILLSWWPSGPGTIVLLLDAVPVADTIKSHDLKATQKPPFGWLDVIVMITCDRGDFVGGSNAVIGWVIHVSYS